MSNIIVSLPSARKDKGSARVLICGVALELRQTSSGKLRFIIDPYELFAGPTRLGGAAAVGNLSSDLAK